MRTPSTQKFMLLYRYPPPGAPASGRLNPTVAASRHDPTCAPKKTFSYWPKPDVWVSS